MDSNLNNDLLIAIETKGNNIDYLKALVVKGANINIKDSLGRPLIHKAIANLDFLKLLLLQDKIDINALDENLSRTVLHLAIEQNNFSVVAMLVKDERINLNIKDSDGDTPLTLSVKKANLSMTNLLIDRGADPNIQDANGNTPISISIIKGLADIAQSLIMSPKIDLNIPNKDSNYPIHIAAINGFREIGILINDPRCDVNVVNKNGLTPFFISIIQKDKRCITEFVKANRGQNRYDKSSKLALNIAAKLGDEEIFCYLLTLFIDEVNDVDNRGNNPLFTSIMNRRYKISSMLIDKINNINALNIAGFTCLHYASLLDDRKTIELLLSRKDIDINIRDVNGDTALTRAIKNNKVSSFQLLLMSSDVRNRAYLEEIVDIIITKSRKKMGEYLVNLYPNVKIDLHKYFSKAIINNNSELVDILLSLIGKEKIDAQSLRKDIVEYMLNNKMYDIFVLMWKSNKVNMKVEDKDMLRLLTCLCEDYNNTIFNKVIEKISIYELKPFLDTMINIAKKNNNHTLTVKIKELINKVN